MLIGYSSRELQKICTSEKAARKALSQDAAARILRRLEDLAAFSSLAEIPFRAPPLDLHPLSEDRAGEFAIKIHRLDRICFRPAGDFTSDQTGNIDLSTVTEIEIVFVGNYHNYG
ncbi:hypothetical protein [Stieleria neptunia]|nr:hypothetical protein [Stieleria neptunia]